MGACESPSLIMGTVHYQIRNHQSNIIMVSNPATGPIDATPTRPSDPLATHTAAGVCNFLFTISPVAALSQVSIMVPRRETVVVVHSDRGVSAVTQNRTLKIGIKGFKTSYSLGLKPALVGPITAGAAGADASALQGPSDRHYTQVRVS